MIPICAARAGATMFMAGCAAAGRFRRDLKFNTGMGLHARGGAPARSGSHPKHIANDDDGICVNK